MNDPALPLQSLTDKLVARKDGAIGWIYFNNPERDLALCQRLVDACFESEDYQEGQAAFMEKRKPQFKGR
jgi:enoyl-CoA hydratase/carnithine racemase